MQLQQLSECRRAARLHFGLAFTDAAQGAAVAQAGLDVDSNIYSDPLQPRQPPDRPPLHQKIMREHLGRTDGEHLARWIFFEVCVENYALSF